MLLNTRPILLASVILLLAWGVAGCRPSDAPRRTASTHSPADSRPGDNTTLPPENLTPEAAADTALDEKAAAEEPSSDAAALAESTEPTSTSDDPSARNRRRARAELLLGTPGKVDPTQRTRPVPKPQPGKTIDLTFDDLKFDIQPDAPFERSMLPQEIEDLHGQKIRIGGYILPSYSNRDIKQFVLVRDNMECCFGPGAALYDCMLVEMEGRGVDFTVRPIVVEGDFHVQEYVIDGRHMAIYHMQGLSIQ